MPGRMLGHYEILEKVGAGGMGEVYRARDTRLGRIVALKLLPPEVTDDPARLRRFHQEAKAVAALNHPNIVTLYAVEESEGRPFISMEFVDGSKLSDLVGTAGLTLERLLPIAIDLADALASAHAKEITHRDLKPGNIMISADGRVKVLDFGLATISPGRSEAADGSQMQTATQEGPFAGTVGYMAPEQLLGRPADHRSDLFALGVVLHEMATGERPFRGTTAAETVSAVLRDPARPLRALRPQLPEGLEAIVLACLEKDPERRPRSASELGERLRQVREGKSGAAGGTGASSAVPSVAILPFADMSPERDQDYFCEGIAEELINALARIRNLRVASRTSSFQFKGAALDIRDIGRRLGAGTVLEGSVRKSGSRLRITAQLVDVHTGFPLWSSRFDRDMKDVFAIQDEVAQSVVDALQVSLHPGESAGAMRPPTESVEAYEYYLRGRKFFYGWGRRNAQLARLMFDRAIQIDPRYALAWAGLADCCSHSYMYWERDPKTQESVLAEALEASLKALELQPDLAEAHVSRGLALSLGRHDDEAEREFESAMRLNPASFEASYFYARHRFTRGDLAGAAALYEKAHADRPEDYQALALLSGVYRGLGRQEQAEAAAETAVRLIGERIETDPDDVRALYLGGALLVDLGERERGVEWADRALAIDPEEPSILYNVACVYSLAGKVNEALDCLEKSAQAGQALKIWIERDSDLDPLRGHPRFKALMERIR